MQTTTTIMTSTKPSSLAANTPTSAPKVGALAAVDGKIGTAMSAAGHLCQIFFR